MDPAGLKCVGMGMGTAVTLAVAAAMATGPALALVLALALAQVWPKVPALRIGLGYLCHGPRSSMDLEGPRGAREAFGVALWARAGALGARCAMGLCEVHYTHLWVFQLDCTRNQRR